MTGDKAVTVEHARGKLGTLARLAATRGTITVISVHGIPACALVPSSMVMDQDPETAAS
jgi:hypothetical protein